MKHFSVAAAEDEGGTREEKLLAYHDSKIRTVEQLLAERDKDHMNQYHAAPYFSVDQDASVLAAVQTMVERDVGSLWVEDAGTGSPAGIVTERDYLRKVVVRGLSSADTAVRDIMTPFTQVVAMISMKDLIKQFTRYHEAQVRYLQEYIPFEVW